MSTTFTKMIGCSKLDLCEYVCMCVSSGARKLLVSTYIFTDRFDSCTYIPISVLQPVGKTNIFADFLMTFLLLLRKDFTLLYSNALANFNNHLLPKVKLKTRVKPEKHNVKNLFHHLVCD